ncbi:hypothetical protein ACJMK2_030732 [Sinanodonta woodiana]|uniref:Coiled-coil domain-containing protein 22 homolog n=1 Tax=Sinanodonta woodiana TaxID=1069815 RepID=A0ABD3WYP3_SINWO
MEEVDKIIIHSLRSIGCDLDENVESLKQFTTELIVSSIVRCLKTINNEIDLPNTLPGAMSAKFRMGTDLAKYIQELGYRNELGYQTFLYSNDADIRKVFMFIVDKLPKETVEAQEETLGASVLLQRAIASTLARQLSSPWAPSYLKENGITWRGIPPCWQREGASSLSHFHSCHITKPRRTGDITKKIPRELRFYFTKVLPVVTNQTLHHEDTAPSVIEDNAMEYTQQQEWESEWNQSGLGSRLSEEEYRARKKERIKKKITDQLRQDRQRGATTAGNNLSQDLQQIMSSISGRASTTTKTKGSRFTHTEKLLFAKDEEKVISEVSTGEGPRTKTEEELQKEREVEMEDLREELINLVSRLELVDMDMRKFTAGIQQMEEEIGNQGRINKEKEEGFIVKKRTLDLLPDAENNVTKLQAVVDNSGQRLVNLANQWEKHRAPLIEQYRDLKELTSKKESEAQKMLEEIKEFRKKMKEVADEARNKEELQKQLASEYERMTKDVNRLAYTKRITEIVANIKKQKKEIDKVLVDTKAVQKEINQLSGKLDRQFTVTDELIFRDAKKDEAVKKAYRHLAALHENCDLLIKTVEETGLIMREIRELEEQIESESHKKVLSNLEKISADYQQMKKENAGMLAKLKGKS